MTPPPTPPPNVPPIPLTTAPKFRYTGALAQEIELRWQDRWEADGTFEAPNPAGPLADPTRSPGAPKKLFVLDMFPYPSGTGLHVGHPLGFIGTDIYSRYKRMTGHNVMYTMGFDAFGLPAEQYAVETGQHPAITTEQPTSPTTAGSCADLGSATIARRSVSTTDPNYYRWTQWIFLQIFNSWYDTEAATSAPDQRADRRSSNPAQRSTDDGRPWSDLSPAERNTIDRGLPPGVRQRCAGQLVPRSRHRRRQRRGHRRRSQRPRQLPRVQAQHAPVDDAHHGVRRPADRRPRPARVDRRHQGDAAQLDRPQRRRDRRVPIACRAASACSPRAPTRCSGRRSWCWRPSIRWSTR